MTLGWPPPARGCRGNSPGWLPPNLWREPKAPLEPGQHGWLLGSATCAGAAPALRIQSSQLSPLGWEELNLSCFSRIASYSRASTESEPSQPQCHTTAPAWMASVGSLGRGCPPPRPRPCGAGRKGRLAGKSTSAQPVWERVGSWHRQGWAGPSPFSPQALRGAQAQALGKGPGKSFLEVASLIVSALRS